MKTLRYEDYHLITLSQEGIPFSYKWHRFVYECRENKRIPGYKVIHLDGNKLNNHIRNLDIEECEEISDED